MCAKCIHSNFESAWYQAENGTCDACSLSTKILQAGIGVIKGLHLNSIATEACPLLALLLCVAVGMCVYKRR